jgi:uncharacterized membrane protein YdjX (TVP38/TMEM64 family)
LPWRAGSAGRSCARWSRRHQDALDRWARRQGGGALFVSRFVPVISFNLINYAASLTAMSWWTFAWATGLGILPITCPMGDRLWSGEPGPWLWLLAAALAGWLIWWLATRRRGSQLGA